MGISGFLPQKTFSGIFDRMKPFEISLLTLSYSGKTSVWIGEELDVSRQWIGQLQKKAERKMLRAVTAETETIILGEDLKTKRSILEQVIGQGYALGNADIPSVHGLIKEYKMNYGRN